jgi:hypothetical protein
MSEDPAPYGPAPLVERRKSERRQGERRASIPFPEQVPDLLKLTQVLREELRDTRTSLETPAPHNPLWKMYVRGRRDSARFALLRAGYPPEEDGPLEELTDNYNHSRYRK